MNEEALRMTKLQEVTTKSCPYCKGEGYFQLRLGGSETCGCCQGTGKK